MAGRLRLLIYISTSQTKEKHLSILLIFGQVVGLLQQRVLPGGEQHGLEQPAATGGGRNIYGMQRRSQAWGKLGRGNPCFFGEG